MKGQDTGTLKDCLEKHCVMNQYEEHLLKMLSWAVYMLFNEFCCVLCALSWLYKIKYSLKKNHVIACDNKSTLKLGQ